MYIYICIFHSCHMSSSPCPCLIPSDTKKKCCSTFSSRPDGFRVLDLRVWFSPNGLNGRNGTHCLEWGRGQHSPAKDQPERDETRRSYATFWCGGICSITFSHEFSCNVCNVGDLGLWSWLLGSPFGSRDSFWNCWVIPFQWISWDGA